MTMTYDPQSSITQSPDVVDGDSASPPPLQSLPSLSPEIESQLVSYIRQLFFRARDLRRPLIQKWENWYKVAHVVSSTRSASAATEVPEVFPVLDAIVSWVTDQSPSFHCAPAVPPLNPWFSHLSQLADDLSTVIRSTWEVDQFDREIEMTVWDAYTYGIGYLKTVWDNGAYQGYGNAVLRRVDPFTIYPDPDAKSPKDANHWFEVNTISRQECERRFPGSITRLNDNFWAEQVASQPTQTDTRSYSTTPTANPAALPGGTSSWTGPMQSTDVVNDPGVTIIESWLRVPCTVDVEIDGTTYPRHYDTWRCVVVAGNRVLMDSMADELWSHGQHPYDRYVPMETGEWYGKSMVELLAPMQYRINKIVNSVANNIDLMGNPVFIDDTRSGLSRTRITNRPGERLTVNPNARADYIQPPQPTSTTASDLVAWYVQEMERVSGLSAVVRGASPTGRNAQGVIDSVQEAAFVRIRKAIRNLSHTIGSSGDKLASMIVEFYDTERLVTLLSTGGNQEALFLQAHHFYIPDESNNRVPMRYALLCDAGESMAQSRGQRIAEADALYALGVIDGEATLEIHNFPNWQVVAERVKQQQAQAGTLGQPPTQRAAARH